MASTKLSSLPELLTMEANDLVAIADVSAGTSGSKKITFANLIKSVPQERFGAISVLDYGAKPDTKRVIDVVTTVGSSTITSATANFQAGDVGKQVFICETGISYPVFQGTIASRTNSTTVVLSGAANSTRASGAAVMYYGNNYATEIQNALNAAGALVNTGFIGDNQPFGMGNASVTFPTTSDGSCYMFMTTLNIPQKVTINADAALLANVGTAGPANRQWALTLARGSGINNLILICNYCQGVLGGGVGSQVSGYIINLQVWGAGREFDAGLVGNEYQTAIRLQGFDWRLNFIWLKGGYRGLWLDNASDVKLNNSLLIGSNFPLVLNDVYEATLNVRSDTPVTGTGSIDRCSKVKLDLSEFIITNTGFAAGEGLKIGAGSATNVNQELDIIYRVTRRGGDCVQISNSRNLNIRLIAENTKPRHQASPGVAIQNGVVYGTGLILPVAIDAYMSSDIVPYTGTPVGTFSLNGDKLLIASENLAGNGTTQGTATTLSRELTTTAFVDVTPALTNTAFKLPAGQPLGKQFFFFNGGSQNLLLFPNSGGSINGQAVNTSITVTPFQTVRIYNRYAGDNWQVI